MALPEKWLTVLKIYSLPTNRSLGVEWSANRAVCGGPNANAGRLPMARAVSAGRDDRHLDGQSTRLFALGYR
jgi:hypothetical protein